MINVIDIADVQLTGDEVVLKYIGEHVEPQFKELVKRDSEIFRDPTSLAFMKAIDKAERVGEFGVVTPHGKSCITCLCSGGKAGLLIMYYNSIGITPIVSQYIAGENVWKWLNENADITVITGGSTLREFRIMTGEDAHECWSRELEDRDEFHRMTAEKEQEAYEKYIEKNGEIGDRVQMCIAECMPLVEYAKKYDNSGWVANWEEYTSEEQPPLEYTVINKIPAITADALSRRLPVFRFWRSNGEPKMARDLTCKYPTVLEILYPEAVSSFHNYDEDRYIYLDEMDGGKLTAVVLDVDEVFDPQEYTEHVWFAIETDAEARTLTLYDRCEAIELFHEKMQWFAQGEV